MERLIGHYHLEKRAIQLFVIFWGVAFASALQAQVNIADLALEVSGPGGITPPGSEGTITITLTNLGPASAGNPPPGLRDVVAFTEIFFSYDNNLGIPIDFTGIVSGPCFIWVSSTDPEPGFDPSFIYEIFVDQLAGGESQSCEVAFRTNPYFPDTEIETHWRIFGTTINDPNPTNDRATLVFLTHAAIPTLSSIGLIAMITALTLAALAALATQRRQRVS